MRTLLVLLVLVCSLSLTAVGAETAKASEQVPPDRQALVMLRVLAYDRNLRERASGTLTIAVINGQSSDGAQKQAAMVAALGRVAQESTVSGLQVKAVAVDYAGPGTLEARLSAAGASAIYVCPGLGKEALQAIAEASRRNSVLAFSENEAEVGLGVGIALVRRGARVSIIIDRSAVAEAGADLAPELLQLSEVRD
ncbi:YfiR family protein [Archangium lansingense]|uniref:YfiR family protein n=1 Tax=Archangium lansingense TaxID=2995310 RepID=A0ABT4AEV7_9BACT|nr:YfiR family protein [Archangium lansinium]MCY1080220.1 YfiR family protein [Archangium lansinium]